MQNEVLRKKLEIRKFNQKVGRIDQQDIEDMEISWKDQKEGISRNSILSLPNFVMVKSIIPIISIINQKGYQNMPKSNIIGEECMAENISVKFREYSSSRK